MTSVPWHTNLGVFVHNITEYNVHVHVILQYLCNVHNIHVQCTIYMYNIQVHVLIIEYTCVYCIQYM